MATNGDERRVRVPYRISSRHMCRYEEDESEVRMGDMVTWCYDTPEGQDECSGELCSVRYDKDGFIIAAEVCMGKDGPTLEYPCDGVFYRMKGGGSDGEGQD